jgi:hypothetical protein
MDGGEFQHFVGGGMNEEDYEGGLREELRRIHQFIAPIDFCGAILVAFDGWLVG